jgi:hypothetical protein
MTFVDYIKDVKAQLKCNDEVEDRHGWVLYCYTNKQIDSNLDHFRKCFDNGLSAYKALLFFHDSVVGLE